MKIAFFIYSLDGGGAERVTVHMADYWSQIGHDITIYTMASAENNRYQLPNTVSLVELNIAGKSKGLSAAVRNNIYRIRTLRSELRKYNPDITISMMSHANVMTGIACIGLKTKCIGSERIFPSSYDTGRLWGLLRKISYRFINTVVTQTEVGKQWVQEHTSAPHVVAIPNPIVLPLPANEPFVTPPSKKNRRYILGAGRLTEQKQFHHLIQAFAKISGDFEHWDLAITGEGGKLTELQNLASELGVNDRVILPGRVGNIADWYIAADIFAMTSEIEGFPNALIEAMAHGVAAISYDCPSGPSEIIESGVNGLLVSTNDQTEFENSLRELINNDLKRSNISTAGKQITAKLDMKKIMSEWDNTISEILSNKA